MVGEGLRPLGAESTPPQLQSLLDACWARDPSARPTAAEIVTALSQMEVRLVYPLLFHTYTLGVPTTSRGSHPCRGHAMCSECPGEQQLM